MCDDDLYTKGASALCAMNTDDGFMTVTFRGNARKCKGDGDTDFARGICQSASADCRNESGYTFWAKTMEMGKIVCDYERNGKLPQGAWIEYRPR